MRRLCVCSLLGSAGALACGAAMASPLESAFSYQGRLRQGGSSYTGTCDIWFTLFDDPSAGNQIGSTLKFDGQSGNEPPVAVDVGLFAVSLDFGANVFNSSRRWLRLEARCSQTAEELRSHKIHQRSHVAHVHTAIVVKVRAPAKSGRALPGIGTR